MKITFLQAGNGDCIHLETRKHHIIIDSGEVCNELESLVEEIINKKEKIDLLVITHYDSDHIKSFISILEKMSPSERKALIKKVWFNATKVGFHGNEKLLSSNDATKFAHLLLEADIKWISELKKGHKKKYDDLTLEVIDGGKIYEQIEEGQLLGNEKNDWNSTFSELESYLDDDEIDKSETNAQSVIIIAHTHDKHILLPGDATPPQIVKALDEYRKNKLLKFDLVKLPHHGSYKNITKETLDKIECSEYVISTNGTKYYHPNKKMILKIVRWGKKTKNKKFTFHLNYYSDLYQKLNIKDDEKKQYKFECDGKREFEF